MQVKKLNKVALVQVSDTTKADLCNEDGPIKNKNKNKEAVLAGYERFTEKIKYKIQLKLRDACRCVWFAVDE